MGVLCLGNKCILGINLLIVYFSITILLLGSLKLALALGNQTDRIALLALKDQFLVGGSSSPAAQALSSWNSSLHFCDWQGVRCGRRHRRVITLELIGLKSGGSISPSIGNLTFLRKVTLFDNALQGNIPKEVGQLRRLRSLNLSNNNLQGEIPVEITNCSNFQEILFDHNKLTGKIPFRLGYMKNLINISFAYNNLVGGIPSSFGNLSTLYSLELAYNHLDGIIPDTLGRLSSLGTIIVAANNLSGTIPPSLYNLSSMIIFDVALNHFFGRLPTEIDIAFPKLQNILIGINHFTGTIPRSLSNISSLVEIDMVQNSISGSVPNYMGNLKNLINLKIGFNHLGSGKEGDLGFFSSLRNCSQLNVFSITKNEFGGVFPESVANLSTRLSIFRIGGNQIFGSIPEGIGNLVNLNYMDMGENFLVGEIPNSIGNLQNLEGLLVDSNNLAGEIPSTIGNLSRLSRLYLLYNNFGGRIPLALKNCQNIQELDLSQNKLIGSIPNQLFGAFRRLVYLSLSHNSFTSLLPFDLSDLKNLAELDVDNNNFYGEIPKKFGEIVGLTVLYMQGNSFQGSIPISFASLRSLENLDLSNNKLSGTIPPELGKLPFLVSLNLSFNQLEGEVPKGGVFRNVSQFSVLGNKKLCGGIPTTGLPKCFKKEKGQVMSTKVMIIVILSILLTSCLAVLLVYCSWRRKSGSGLIPIALFGDSYLNLSYKDLLQATQGFASSNLIGSGSFGSVYKGVLHQQGKVVAIKVFNLQNRSAAKSFMAECKALRKVRHRNLLKVITSCSSIDYQGNDFKALVFEVMPSGSLESWLHEQYESRRYLNLAQRLDIAIDVANAIVYLHHDCETPIIHCDLKPSNILLDEEMIVHVGDFGLAKLLTNNTDNMGTDQTGSSIIKGTIGYIAPEYGMGRSMYPEGDVYSYGILLLEMATGKRPTDDLFSDDLSLHNFCQMALPEQLGEILDFFLLEEIGEIRQSQPDIEGEIWECLVSFIKIGVACSVESPTERMGIKDAIKQLHATKARLHQLGISKEDER